MARIPEAEHERQAWASTDAPSLLESVTAFYAQTGVLSAVRKAAPEPCGSCKIQISPPQTVL